MSRRQDEARLNELTFTVRGKADAGGLTRMSALLAVLVMVSIPGSLHASTPNMFDPVSPPAYSIRSLFTLILYITAGIFVVVEGLLIYFAIRYRRRQSGTHSEPAQVYGSTPIEVAWTAVPTLIVFVMLLIIVRIEYEVRADTSVIEDDAIPLQVRVVGHQWWWEFNYEGYDGKPLAFTTANELVVPISSADQSRPVILSLESADVCHSFWMPRLAGKTDLIPGRRNQLWFQTYFEGMNVGQCAEYCGTQHANMLLHVRSIPPDQFEQWLADQAKPADIDPSVEEGRRFFESQTCVNCHTVKGTVAKGKVGPDLTHLMSRSTIAAGMVPNDHEHLKSWVLDPQDTKPGCLMPAFQFEAKEIDSLIAYLESLK